MQAEIGDITQILQGLAAHQNGAEERLIQAVYGELHAVASQKLRRMSPNATLSPTVLVHEAYLRVFHKERWSFQNRKQLFFVMAQAMWRIVIEGCRRKRFEACETNPAELSGATATQVDDLLDLDQVLTEFQAKYPDEYIVVMLRKALGFDIAQTAEALGVSAATVKRDWAFARAELARRLRHGTSV